MSRRKKGKIGVVPWKCQQVGWSYGARKMSPQTFVTHKCRKLGTKPRTKQAKTSSSVSRLWWLRQCPTTKGNYVQADSQDRFSSAYRGGHLHYRDILLHTSFWKKLSNLLRSRCKLFKNSAHCHKHATTRQICASWCTVHLLGFSWIAPTILKS